MTRAARVLFCLMWLAAPAAAQEVPSWEFFAGYGFEHANVREYFRSTPVIYTIRNQTIGLNGWQLAATENIRRSFGGTLQVTGSSKTAVLRGSQNSERRYSVLYGPRFAFRQLRYVVPYVHVLLGGAYSRVQVKPSGPHDSDFAFAAAGGFGVDVNAGRAIAVRAFQVEYFHSAMLGAKAPAFRASTGVVFRLGRKN